MPDTYDVVVVGSGPAGCTAAIFFGRKGLRVALLESHRDPNFYKRLCTHSIRSSAVPTIRRLGLDTELERMGAVRHYENGWTKDGWFHERGTDGQHGYNIRRLTLDPFMRATAAEVPGVDLMMGARVRDLTTDGSGRVDGVVAEIGGERQRINGRLVVGADGYMSKVAELAGLPARFANRVRLSAGYRNCVPAGWSGAGWFQEPDVNYIFCNDDGVTMLAAFLNKDRLAEFGGDREAALLGSFAELPCGPDLSAAERASDVIGTTDYPSVTRRHIVAPGVALIGDAAMVGDPLWGTGCGWAFQSAEWLADAVSDALRSGRSRDVDISARRYQRKHHRKLFPHQLINIDFSQKRKFNLIQRLAYAGAVRDQKVADRVFKVATRNASPLTLFDPLLLGRAAIASRRPLTPAAAAPMTGTA